MKMRLWIFASIIVAVSASFDANAAPYARCRPIKDLVEQHRCLMEDAIIARDKTRLENLAKTAYVDINDTPNGKTYLQWAIREMTTSHAEGADEIAITLIELGADVNISGNRDNPIWFALTVLPSDYDKRQQHRKVLDAAFMAGLDPDVTFIGKGGNAEGRLFCFLGRARELEASANPESSAFGKWLVKKIIDIGGHDCAYRQRAA
jgi:hypothetical protein